MWPVKLACLDWFPQYDLFTCVRSLFLDEYGEHICIIILGRMRQNIQPKVSLDCKARRYFNKSSSRDWASVKIRGYSICDS